MFQPKRHLSQHFLQSSQLVKKLVAGSSIGKNDTVLEIGPGKGVITLELARICRQVIAVEIDSDLIKLLQNKLPSNVVLFQADATKFSFPSSSFKIFCNPPFYLEGKLVRRILKSDHPPLESWLVVIKKPALRWTASSRSSLFSVLHGPWFILEIIHQFKKCDFKPHSTVEAVLMRIKKRERAKLTKQNKKSYQKFVKKGFQGGGRINRNLSAYFSKSELNHLTQKMRVNFDSKPSDLSLQNWIDLFQYWQKKSE